MTSTNPNRGDGAERPAATESGTHGHLDGHVAIVTGGSRGIGLAVAERLIADGAKICITGRKADALSNARERLPKGTVLTVQGRSDDPVHRTQVLDAVEREFGYVTTLVNNVGINPVYGPLLDLQLDIARKIIDVNVLSNLAWVQAICERTSLGFARQSGSVINIASVTAQTPSPGIGMYGISKAAIEHLTRTLATELAPDIRVNAVAPAVIKTAFAQALYEGKEEEVASRYPLGRLGEASDVAAAVAFLASADAAWITGQVLNVDGGLLAAGERA